MSGTLAQSTLSLLGRSALLAISGIAQSTRPGVDLSARDRTIIGLAGKGHSLDAICEFLGMLTVDLLSRLCALNLSTPYNGSVRRARRGKTAWQIAEIRQLIEQWEQNLSSASIAVRLGRSPSSIRSKKRWLGLATRSYRDIVTDLSPCADIAKDDAFSAHKAIRKRTKWGEATYLPVISRFLSYQHYKGIASDLNLTPAQVRSKIKICGLPPDRERQLQSMDYQPDTPHALALKANYTVKTCGELGQVYVTPRKNPRRFCPAYYDTEQYRHRAAFGGENCSVSHLC